MPPAVQELLGVLGSKLTGSLTAAITKHSRSCAPNTAQHRQLRPGRHSYSSMFRPSKAPPLLHALQTHTESACCVSRRPQQRPLPSGSTNPGGPP